MSSDEMADLTLQVLPLDTADLQPLLQAARRKWLAQEIQGHRMLLRADPDDVEDHHTLAMYYLQAGQRDSSFAHFEQTLRLRPAYPEALVNYGLALAASGRVEASITHLERAVASRPTFSKAHFNLGMVLYRSGQPEKARRHFEEAARLRPEMAAAIRRTVAALPR